MLRASQLNSVLSFYVRPRVRPKIATAIAQVALPSTDYTQDEEGLTTMLLHRIAEIVLGLTSIGSI